MTNDTQIDSDDGIGTTTDTDNEMDTDEVAHSDNSIETSLIDFQAAIDDVLHDGGCLTVTTNFNDHEDGEDSHVEWDPRVFHASQIGYCRRRALAKKLGYDDVSGLKGTFAAGDMFHSFVQEAVVNASFKGDLILDVEKPVSVIDSGIEFVGHTDLYDPRADVVYDIKTRGGWYNFDPPEDRVLDQLHVYMAALDATYGQVVYVNKRSKDTFEVRTWPENNAFTFSPDRWDDIVTRAQDIRDALVENGVPTDNDELDALFETCDSYFCDSETMSFPDM